MQWGERAGQTARRLLVLTVLTTALAAGLGAEATARMPSPALQRVTPLLRDHGFADPSVVAYSHGYLAVSTGIGAPRATAPTPTGPWTVRSRAMVELPRWALTDEIWASDVVHLHHRWLLYYSAPVRGLGAGGRCIGVATARGVLGRFHPVGRHPLVCPGRARTPRAWDALQTRGRALPRTGVIDPSGFHGKGGHQYLLYKTQGYPSSIRILPLSSDGTRARHHARSRELIRARGIVENPALVRRQGRYVLFTSEGFYGDCGYRTTWRSSHGLLHWGRAKRHLLLRHTRAGLCGPGGADVVMRGRAQSLVFFHGWTCAGGLRPCPGSFHMDRRRGPQGQRSLYAAHLSWTRKGAPRVRGYLHPR